MTLVTEVHTDPSFAAHVDTTQVQEVVREVVVQQGELACSPLTRPGTVDVCSGAMGTSELTVVIADDDRVRELNRCYRGVDSTTDVLAFGGSAEGAELGADWEVRHPFVEAPGAIAYLGDVVISYPRVLAQAEEQGHSPDRELALLVIHGVLHLLGYNHTTPEEEAIMWAQQEAILRRLG